MRTFPVLIGGCPALVYTRSLAQAAELLALVAVEDDIIPLDVSDQQTPEEGTIISAARGWMNRNRMMVMNNRALDVVMLIPPVLRHEEVLAAVATVTERFILEEGLGPSAAGLLAAIRERRGEDGGE